MTQWFCRLGVVGLLVLASGVAVGASAASSESQADRERKGRVAAFKQLVGKETELVQQVRCTYTCSDGSGGSVIIEGGVAECIGLCESICGEECVEV